MKSDAPITLAVAILLTTAFAAPVTAQNPHVGHVASAFGDTPDGQGLLPTAMAEAEVAARHAGLAAADPADLDGMKRHVGHVQHALDPSTVEAGPGLGYGVGRAATGVARHIELAAGVDGAAPGVVTHAPHIARSALNTVERTEEILRLAARVQASTSADAAAPLVTRIAELSAELIEGADANGDGRVGWQEGEGGLATARQHLGFLMGG